MVNRHPLVTAIDRITAPIRRRVMLMIGRAVLQAVNDGARCQTVQVTALSGEVLNDVERPTQYGFTSHPHPGADVVLLAVGGNRDHGVAICVGDRRYRFTGLTPGEVVLHDDQGQKIHLKRNGLYLEGRNVYVKTSGILRLEGDGVDIHGRRYVQTDVHGKGRRETHAGGDVYNTDTYTTGATGDSTEHGLDQADIPSDHPEGP